MSSLSNNPQQEYDEKEGVNYGTQVESYIRGDEFYTPPHYSEPTPCNRRPESFQPRLYSEPVHYDHETLYYDDTNEASKPRGHIAAQSTNENRVTTEKSTMSPPESNATKSGSTGGKFGEKRRMAQLDVEDPLKPKAPVTDPEKSCKYPRCSEPVTEETELFCDECGDILTKEKRIPVSDLLADD